ncbi:hypothetical protein K9M74_04525 [Candidatus Woesearchaeota archaeon]|nr:hypothetical protein [Candidatus Woesearchaeota archaeon]
MKIKILSVMMVALLAFAMLPGFVAAEDPVGLDVLYIKIDGEEHSVYDDNTENVLEVRRGQTLPIRVRVAAATDIEDVQIIATISGYEFSEFETDKVLQQTRTFDMDAGREKSVDMELQIPVKMESDEAGAIPTKLRIFVTDRADLVKVFEYNLDVQGVERQEAILIKEAYLNPSDEVLAGRALSALVKVENVGDNDLDSVTLMVSVPELNIKDTETLDDLEAGQKATFEETILRFPKSAQPGFYTVEYKVKFNDYYSVVKTSAVEVLAAQVAEDTDDNSVITVPSMQAMTGDSVIFPISVQNNANEDKSYVLSVQGVESWGTYTVDPNPTVIVSAGQTKTVFLHVTANDGVVGNQIFQLSIESDNEVKQVSLTAAVADNGARSWDGLKKTLEIGLIILVIILILIGLVVGFNKLRGSDDDEDEDAKTYY